MPTRKKKPSQDTRMDASPSPLPDLPPYDPEKGDLTPGFREWFAANPKAEYKEVMQRIFKEQYNG